MNEKTSTDSVLVGEFIGELDVPDIDVVGAIDVLGLKFARLILVDDGDIFCSLVSSAFASGLCSVSVNYRSYYSRSYFLALFVEISATIKGQWHSQKCQTLFALYIIS